MKRGKQKKNQAQVADDRVTSSHWAPGTQHSLTNLSGHGQALRVGDRGELLVPQPLNGVLVISQIQLGAHQDDGCVGAVVSHLRVPLPCHRTARTHAHTHRWTCTNAYIEDTVDGREEKQQLVGWRGRTLERPQIIIRIYFKQKTRLVD